MNRSTTTKLAAYGGVLLASFGAAAGLAVAVGPIDTSSDTHADPAHGEDPHADDPHADGAHGGRPHVPGVSLDADGFRIVPGVDVIVAGQPVEYPFRIVDADGATVTDFDVTHERELHLIVVSRRFDVYHHVHPERDETGAWTAELPALPAGSYRVFADTQPTGSDGVTLGIDATVEAVELPATGAPSLGDVPVAAPAEDGGVRVGTKVDGYDVEMEGTPAVGTTTLTFSIERDGAPVTPDPYLGASGHLVALRDGDLAFLHVHPLEGDTASRISFAAELPTPGTYHLFLDVSLDGDVHTVPFAINVPEPTPGDAPPHDDPIPDGDDHQDGGH